MTLDMWLAVGILVAAVVLFISEKLRVDVVALGVVVTLMITGLLTTEEALAGFSSTAVLTIGALFIVGGGVMNTGLAGTIGRRILAIAGHGESRLIVVLMAAVALLSGVMSDTGTVAVLLPAAIVLARNANISPSRLLIPLSFGSLLGGASTLIGTPPNIIVRDALVAGGYEPFSFFTFTPMGIILTASGILFMALVGRHLLPDRRPHVDAQRLPTPKELVEEYRLPDQLLRLRVRRGSDMIGKTVVETDLGREFSVVVLQILRPSEPRPSFQFARSLSQAMGGQVQETAELSNGDTVVQLDDVLIVKGDPDDVAHAAAHWNLGVQPAAAKDERALIDREVGVAEVVLPRRSRLVGKTLADERFGSTYKLTVLNIQRPGVHEALDLSSTKLAFGDILLVQGPWEQIAALKERRRDFVVVGQPETMIEAPRKEKANLALLILAGMIAAMIAGVASLTAVAMVAGLAMVLSGCLTMDEAYEFIDWRSLFLIAGMIPLSTALEKAGVVDFAAQGLVQSLGVIGPLAVLAGLFLFTSAFTQVISNTATTVIIAPLAVASATQLGVQPYAFLMAIAIAASMAFATPVASPTNTLVMGAGHYTFGDYARVGLPLILIALVEVVLVLPLLFPF
ncbi:MAG TPA: SLC13 family permease [Candidatus Sulfomarinibacteraceae bacterium]|nr:SLC13 family permease [Candidatus Sulfomarinibacteraceae bacterium]